jgi:ABC-2 type transport system ATP-binding protein
MITVSHISKSFGKAKVLDDISAQFETGRVHQIIGQVDQARQF